MQVTLWCILASYNQTKDRGFKIVIETGELWAEQVLWLHELYNKNAWATIGENPVDFDDIKDDLPKAIQQWPKKKTPSERLRAVLAVYGKQQGEDPDTFYKKKMEEIIEFYKSKLTD